MDAEVQEIDEDKEVECIYNDAKDKHRRMLTGTYIFSVVSKVSKVQSMECKRINGTMLKVSKEIKYMYYCMLQQSALWQLDTK